MPKSKGRILRITAVYAVSFTLVAGAVLGAGIWLSDIDTPINYDRPYKIKMSDEERYDAKNDTGWEPIDFKGSTVINEANFSNSDPGSNYSTYVSINNPREDPVTINLSIGEPTDGWSNDMNFTVMKGIVKPGETGTEIKKSEGSILFDIEVNEEKNITVVYDLDEDAPAVHDHEIQWEFRENGGNNVWLADVGAPLTGDYALEFDGEDDYAVVSDDDGLDIGESNFTIVSWVNYTHIKENHHTIISKRHDYLGEGQNGYDFFITRDTGKIRIVLDGGNNLEVHDSNTVIPTGEWHHLAATFDRDGNVKFYLDSSPDGSADISSSSGSLTNDRKLRMGAEYDDSDSLTDFLDGKIDDIRIYNQTLTENQIQDLYNKRYRNDVAPNNLVGWWPMQEGEGNTVYDESGNGNNGTIHGPNWTLIGESEGDSTTTTSTSLSTNSEDTTQVESLATKKSIFKGSKEYLSESYIESEGKTRSAVGL